MTVERPVLRYHGGKWMLAPWIISQMPQHRIYVEPYGGGGSVLMRKPRSYAEVYNDSWDVVVNVFRVLRDPAMACILREQLRLTPFSRTEFRDCGDVELMKISNPIERARRTILRSFAGFGSASTNAAYATGFRSNSSRSGTTPAQDWMHFPDYVNAFTERLSGVVIENKEAIPLMLQHDTPQTLFYVDPPYPHSTRNMNLGNAAYAHELTDSDHRALAKCLRSLRGIVMLSGYRCDLYDELWGDWECRKKDHFADGARRRVECLWVNAAASSIPPDGHLDFRVEVPA